MSSTLNDASHFWSGDLAVSASGDILLVSGLQRSQQRILRRLATNPGAYISHASYGAGLPQFIGQNADPAQIAAVTRSQMLLEDSVSPTPSPVVTINATPGLPNAISQTINYTDQPSQAPTVLSFTVTN